MYNLDEEKIECTLGNREFGFLAGHAGRDCCVFISHVASGFAAFRKCPAQL